MSLTYLQSLMSLLFDENLFISACMFIALSASWWIVAMGYIKYVPIPSLFDEAGYLNTMSYDSFETSHEYVNLLDEQGSKHLFYVVYLVYVSVFMAGIFWK